MTFNFENKNVLITGGSRGIGRVTAQLFAASGANVIITYKTNREAAEQTLADLKPGNHSCYQLDVTDPIATKHIFNLYREKYKTLDVLVNNAAVFLEHKILTADYDSW
jgi:3-oxoacyl-[acyl-carrier protein] reductase